eukprot:s2007_g11.t1
MSQDDRADPETAEEPDADLFAAFDDYETLPCSCSYVFVCILMPLLNGAVSGFIWPGYSLHFAEQGWSLVTGGVAITVGFGLRVATQQLQLRAGYWLIVPLAAIHLTFAVLALIYQTSLWAIFGQLVVLLCLDPTCAIEGIAFDTFGASEVQARQATSTLLSVFTIAVASSCTVGGILYDLGGWTAVASYHSICQGLQLLLLCFQPPIRKSFMEFFFGDPSDDAVEATATAATSQGERGLPGSKKTSFAVLPGPMGPGAMELPGAVIAMASEELEVQEVGSEAKSQGSQRGSTDSEFNALRPRVPSESGLQTPAQSGSPV